MNIFKILGSLVVGMVGGYLMYRGKKIQNPNMMILGGVLFVLSYYLFS